MKWNRKWWLTTYLLTLKSKSWYRPLTLTKSQNFQNGPVPLSFLSTFQFWALFLHLKLRNCTNVQFLKSWLLHKSWPKVKIFKNDLSCSIFHIHSNFGVRSFIWDSKIEQMAQFQDTWLLCWSRSKVKIFESNLSCSIFFATWKPPIWPLLRSTNNIHLVWIPSRLSSRLH